MTKSTARFNVTFEIDNESFGEDSHTRAAEIHRILLTIGRQVEAGPSMLDQGGSVFDANGNTVGRWSVECP